MRSKRSGKLLEGYDDCDPKPYFFTPYVTEDTIPDRYIELTNEMQAWCKEQSFIDLWCRSGRYFQFASELDAMMFKLRWA